MSIYLRRKSVDPPKKLFSSILRYAQKEEKGGINDGARGQKK